MWFTRMKEKTTIPTDFFFIQVLEGLKNLPISQKTSSESIPKSEIRWSADHNLIKPGRRELLLQGHKTSQDVQNQTHSLE